MTEPEQAKIVQGFFDHLVAKDLPAFLALWARDAVIEMPFTAPGFPARIEGEAALREFWTGAQANAASLAFDNLRIEALAAPGWWMSRQEGRIQTLDGKPYNNRYVCLFEIVDGRLQTYHEYYNPLVVMETFGQPVAEAAAAQ